MKTIGFIRGLSPVGRVLVALSTLVVTGLAVWLLWAVVYRLFYQGQDLTKAKGDAVVATEQGTAETRVVDQTMNTVRERDRGRDEIRIVVQEGRSNVNDAWKGESVGTDVDRAGAAALCGVHDSLCRQPPAPPVQPVR